MEQGNWFVALVVPEQAGLHRLTADLPAGLRRFQPGDLHLTLAFLGACGAERAQLAWRAIADQPQWAITAEAGSWRAMGRPERPSAYALTLGQGAQLAAGLIERLDGDERFAALGLDPYVLSPKEFAALVRADVDRIGRLVRETGIKAD